MMSEEKLTNDLISCELQRLHKNLFENFLKQSCVKHLKNIGMQHISNVVKTSHLTLDFQTRKMQFSEIKTLIDGLDVVIDELIKNTLNESYRKELRSKISQTIFKNSTSSTQDTTSNKKEDNEEFNITSKRYVESLRDISQQMIEMSFPQMTPSPKIEGVPPNLKITEENSSESSLALVDDDDDDCSSSISVSSVHTSELSSYDDEISMSSDEEIARKKKKLSLKDAKEYVERKFTREESKSPSPEHGSMSPQQSTSVVTDDSDYSVTNASDDENYTASRTNDENKKKKRKIITQEKEFQSDLYNAQPKRIRKPNLKYTSEGMISPFSVDPMSFENHSTEKDTATNDPPKRGRPRKT